jgi:hypothetical protein
MSNEEPTHRFPRSLLWIRCDGFRRSMCDTCDWRRKITGNCGRGVMVDGGEFIDSWWNAIEDALRMHLYKSLCIIDLSCVYTCA